MLTKTKLSDVIKLKSGKSIKPGGAGKYPVYGSNGKIGGSDEYKYENAIIIGRVGAYCGSIEYSEGKFWASDNTLIAQPSSVNYDIKYLSYLLRSLNLRRYAGGSAQPLMTQTVIKSIEVDIPETKSQIKIGRTLSAYDDLIENNSNRIVKLEAMARLFYRYYFEVPEAADWEHRPISELLSGHIGGGWGADEHGLSFPEPAYVIRGTDIPPARVGSTSNVPFRYHKSSNLRSRKLIPGDIIFEVSGGSKGQPLGRSLLVTEKLLSAFDNDVMCASFCKRVTPNKDIIAPEILYLSFLDAYENGEIETYSVQSTGISNFKWSEYIERVTRPVPPVEIQQEFQEKVVPIFQQINTLGIKNSNLRKARDLLLPRLMSGDIKL